MMHPDGKSVVRHNAVFRKKTFGLKGFHPGAFAEDELGHIGIGQNYFVIHPPLSIEAAETEIKCELGKARELALPEAQVKFFPQFADDRLPGRLARIDRAAETAPMVGIKDVAIESRSCIT